MCLGLEATLGYLRYQHLWCPSSLPGVPRQTLGGSGACSLAAPCKGRTASFQVPGAPLSQTSPCRVGGPQTGKLEVASLAENKKGWHRLSVSSHEMHPSPCAGLMRVCFLLETTVIEI